MSVPAQVHNLGYNIRFRTNWRGQLIMEIEVDRPMWDGPACFAKEWRDATVSDFTGQIAATMNFSKVSS